MGVALWVGIILAILVIAIAIWWGVRWWQDRDRRKCTQADGTWIIGGASDKKKLTYQCVHSSEKPLN